MNKKLNIIFMVMLIVVSSFCLTTFGAGSKTQAQAETQTTVMAYCDDTFYSELATQSVETETISYSRKEVTQYVINTSFPNYYNSNASLTNTCANVGGANVVGYYDRYYDDLIPNCTVGITRSNRYTYYPMNINNDKIQSVIDKLYTSMKTNTKENGTSEEDCLNGLKTYVQSQGRSITYTSTMANNALNLDKFDSQLKEGNPVMLFLSGYNFVSLADSGSKASISKDVYSGNHIVVAYGYQKVDYYNAGNTLIKSYTYIYVSTGINGVSGFYLLNGGGKMDAAQAVAIK